MEHKWVYYLGIIIVILGLIVLVGQAFSSFIIGFQEGCCEGEPSDMNVWFENDSPLRLLILGTILIGFNRVLNKEKVA